MPRTDWLIALLIGAIAAIVVYAIRWRLSARGRGELARLSEELRRLREDKLQEDRLRQVERELREDQRHLREEIDRLRVTRLLEERSWLQEELDRQRDLKKVFDEQRARLQEELFQSARSVHIDELRLRLRVEAKLISPTFGPEKMLPSGAKALESQEVVPSGVVVDNVHFTLTAPTMLPFAQASEIHFWMHVDDQKKTVLELAHEIHIPAGVDLSVKSAGPYPIERGSRISVRIKIDGLICRDNHQWMVWTGEIGHSALVVEVPADASLGTHVGSASIRLNGCQIAKMLFVLNVGRERGESTEIPCITMQHNSAFASYASEDRAEVVRCVQAMETAYKGLKVFLDVADIRSGENWEERLNTEIANADIFYLFWCRHAAASEWVKKEWQLALKKKGGTS